MASDSPTEPADVRPMAVSVEKYAHLASMEENWDSYGGHPMTAEALKVVQFLSVVPTGDGGVQFEWHANGQDVEIEVGPDGRLCGFYWENT